MMSSHDSFPREVGEEEAYEEKNVHEVYQQIAEHFSSTRYKPWPIVERFLKDQRPGAIGLDVGCGNGKYLPVNRDVFIIASDRQTWAGPIDPFLRLSRSDNLARIAVQHQPHSTIVADILNLPHPSALFDFALSIAVVHHLSTPLRRVQAISETLRTLKPGTHQTSGGKALIYVWALEQRSSRRGWDKGHQQDVMVPWVMKNRSPLESQTEQSKTFHRYYHLYQENELERDIKCAGGHVLESGYEKDNWWAIATRLKE